MSGVLGGGVLLAYSGILLRQFGLHGLEQWAFSETSPRVM